MYAELQIEVECEGLNFRQSSNLQGVIMETIQPEYAERLHVSALKPYSQCLVREKEKNVWNIRTVTEEAYEKLLLPMSRISEFELKKGAMHGSIRKKTVELVEESELMKEFYELSACHDLNVSFQTPTAFKSGGKYIFYPDLHLFYQSLMQKYSAASGQFNMLDEDALEQLEKSSEIVRYRLQSIPFPLEGTRVTGFVGTVRIHIRGTDTMARYARLLLRAGRFSGIGIKAAMGMGAIRLLEQGERT